MTDALTNKIELEEPKKRFRFGFRLNRRKLAVIGGILLFIVAFGIIFGLLPLLAIKSDVAQLSGEIKGISEGIQGQNLNQSIEKLASSKKILSKLASDYKRLVWLRPIPFIGGFYQDGQRLIKSGNYLLEAGEIAVEALKPYADILGLEGKDETNKPE